MDKIFSALVFTLPGETKETRSRSVKNVRRHAASLMVKIGQKYPLLLLPVFDRIKMIVSDLESKADALSRMEIVCLQVYFWYNYTVYVGLQQANWELPPKLDLNIDNCEYLFSDTGFLLPINSVIYRCHPCLKLHILSNLGN